MQIHSPVVAGQMFMIGGRTFQFMVQQFMEYAKPDDGVRHACTLRSRPHSCAWLRCGLRRLMAGEPAMPCNVCTGY